MMCDILQMTTTTRHSDEGGGELPPDRLAPCCDRLQGHEDAEYSLHTTTTRRNVTINFRASPFITFFTILTLSVVFAESGECSIVVVWRIFFYNFSFFRDRRSTHVERGLLATPGDDKFCNQRLAARSQFVQNEVGRSSVCR